MGGGGGWWSLIELSHYKKAILLITNSNYSAHTTLLFIELSLLKVQDMFKLKL